MLLVVSSRNGGIERCLQFDADVLELGVEVERVNAAFSADAARFHAAKWSAQVAQEPVVDPHEARFDASGDAMCAADILRPHRRAQPVFGVIGHGDRFIFVIEWLDVANRPEDLLFDATRILGQSRPDRGLDKVTLIKGGAEFWNPTTCDDLGAFLARELVVGEDLVAMPLRDKRPDRGPFCKWIASDKRFGALLERVDKWLGADSSSIARLRDTMADYTASIERVVKANDYVLLFGVTFAIVGLAHLLGGWLGGWFAATQGEDATLASEFFWVVVIATTAGLTASFTRARELEGIGASKFGVLFIFLLVAVIGTRMDVTKIADAPAFMAIGFIWMLFHVILLLSVAKLIKAPFFFVAVGSKANIGGAASAPVVAAAFHPALAPVGVLLAVLGYALGTYGAILCAQMMAAVG